MTADDYAAVAMLEAVVADLAEFLRHGKAFDDGEPRRLRRLR